MSISRVTKVVKGGKNLSFSALVVVGDGHGVVGFGIGKAKEVPSAIKKAHRGGEEGRSIRVPMQGHDDSASGARPLRRRVGAAQAGAGRHGHHRRRRGARGRRVGGHPQRADQVARVGQPAQRRARDVRGADGPAGIRRRWRGCAARTSKSSAGERRVMMARRRRTTSEGGAANDAEDHAASRARSASTGSRRWRCAGSACAGSATPSELRGHAGDARDDPEGAAPRDGRGVSRCRSEQPASAQGREARRRSASAAARDRATARRRRAATRARSRGRASGSSAGSKAARCRSTAACRSAGSTTRSASSTRS